MWKFVRRLRLKSNTPQFIEKLSSDPVDIVREFVCDYKTWNDFAFAEHEISPESGLAEQSYGALVRKFCGPEKKHQLLTFSNDSSFHPSTDEVVNVEESKEKAVVRVKHGNRGWDECLYEFEFQRRFDRWVLDEVYYLDEYDNNARLNFL